MSEKTKRLVIILPEDVFDEFQDLVDVEYETMSAVGRRLILEWIERMKSQKPLKNTEGDTT